MRKATLAGVITAGALVWALLLMPALSVGAAPGFQADPTTTATGTVEATATEAAETTTATADTATTATTEATATADTAAATATPDTAAATATPATPSTLPGTGGDSGAGWIFLIIAVILFTFGMLTLASRRES